jgi:hypothetical protein
VDRIWPEWDSLFAETDTLSAREIIGDRVFAATLPETIATRGYVWDRDDGKTVFDTPNAEVLLSDRFVATHCFAIRRTGDHKGWVGLAFRPRNPPNGIADIKGILWLDGSSAELRRLEYLYDNLKPAEYTVCDSAPFIKMTPDRLAETPPPYVPPPGCMKLKNSRSNGLDLGGEANFARLPTGEWLITDWFVRMPPDLGVFRALPWRSRVVGMRTERCVVGPKCRTITAMRARLVTTRGAITAVWRRDTLLYSSDSGSALLARMMAKRAGRHPAGVEGLIVDEEQRPLAGATVQVEGPGRAARTDSGGHFSIRTLPADSVTITMRCAAHQSVRFRVALLPDSTRHVAVALPRDSSQLQSRLC